MIKKMLGPVYKYNIQYKMASEYMKKRAQRMNNKNKSVRISL